MNSIRIASSDRRIAIAIVVYAVMLALLPLILSRPDFKQVFSEEGPFEQLAVVAWIFTALVILFRIRPLGMRAFAFALLCLVFAAREADWHKAFTADSMLKTNYYKHAAAPFGEKLAAGLVALTAALLLLYVGFVVARFLFARGGWKSRSGGWLMIGTALVVLGKILDRLPATLSVDYGIVLPALVGLYADAYEEGLEVVHPLLLAWSVWISQFERRYLS
jgi:hypothetical protein